MKTPHLLLAATNVLQMKNNLSHILEDSAIEAINLELKKNITELFSLGLIHYNTAIQQREWRQIVSRLYYAAYNIGRAVRLFSDGSFSNKPVDHKMVGIFPDNFPHAAIYFTQFPILREDRNLADYDHSAQVGDLVISLTEARDLVSTLIEDSRRFLGERGILL